MLGIGRNACRLAQRRGPGGRTSIAVRRRGNRPRAGGCCVVPGPGRVATRLAGQLPAAQPGPVRHQQARHWVISSVRLLGHENRPLIAATASQTAASPHTRPRTARPRPVTPGRPAATSPPIEIRNPTAPSAKPSGASGPVSVAHSPTRLRINPTVAQMLTRTHPRVT